MKFNVVLCIGLIAIFTNNVMGNMEKLVSKGVGPVYVLVASTIFDEKHTFISSTIKKQHRTIMHKIGFGAAGYGMSELMKNESRLNQIENITFKFGDSSSEGRKQGVKTAFACAGGYICVNGTLRLVANQCSLNEEFIDQKCDEYFSENVVWIAKPVINAAVDLAYHYVTIECVKGIADGINKSK